MKSRIFYITDEADEMLNRMKEEIGASRSASVIIGIKKHYDSVIKEDSKPKKLIKEIDHAKIQGR